MHFAFRLLLSSAFFMYSASISVPQNTHVECESNGLCFAQTPIPESLSQIGFAFPVTSADVPPEMLVSMQVELPYGFVAFTPIGSSATSPRPMPGALGVTISIFIVIDFDELQDPAFLATLTPKDYVIQVSELLPNQTFAPTGVTGITVSPVIFTVNTSFYRIVIRFQGDATQALGISSVGNNVLSFMSSDILPTYLTPFDGDTPPAALFDAAPATTSLFDFGFIGEEARFDNYEEMLKIAGFDPENS